MDVKYYKDATEFLTHTGQYLARDEARYGLMTVISKAAEIYPDRIKDAWFCTVGKGDEIYAATMRTPPRNILLAYFSGGLKPVADKLVQAVSQKYGIIPGVIGDKELADVFVERWCKGHGIKIKFTMTQKIFRLDKVNNIPISQGKLRQATLADEALLKKWMHAFHIDIGGENMGEPEMDITPNITAGLVYVWEDGKPVSMAAKRGSTGKGMTVGLVYTPLELRGKGYASSCVAELSRNILKSGQEFCMLYTDLANPTSNSIYMKIGYKPVGDSVEHTFEG